VSPIESVTTALEVPGNVEGGNGAYPGAQSVSRALMLLKCFSDAQPEWNLGDLAQYTGLNKATVHRLLAALESEGFIVRSARTGGYRLGPTLIVLGGCAMRSNDLRTVSRRMLEALAQQTGESTTLEVLAGSEVVILDEVSSRHLLGMSQDVGARLPAHAWHWRWPPRCSAWPRVPLSPAWHCASSLAPYAQQALRLLRMSLRRAL